MSEQINLRIEKELIKDIEEIAKMEHIDRAAFMKKIIAEGLEHTRLRIALQKYILHEISIGKAAEIAKIPIYEFIQKLTDLGIPSGLSLEEYQRLMDTNSS